MKPFYKYSDKELKHLLSTLVVLIDTREKKVKHITDYLKSKDLPYKFQKLVTGDYTIMMPKNDDFGITRDLYFPIAIERKNGVDELVDSIKDRTRFENELIRTQGISFTIIIEDTNGYENIILGKYRSNYKPNVLIASLKSFESRYKFTTVFLQDNVVGNYIYYHLYYFARNVLKGLNL